MLFGFALSIFGLLGTWRNVGLFLVMEGSDIDSCYYYAGTVEDIAEIGGNRVCLLFRLRSFMTCCCLLGLTNWLFLFCNLMGSLLDWDLWLWWNWLLRRLRLRRLRLSWLGLGCLWLRLLLSLGLINLCLLLAWVTIDRLPFCWC